jgi:hypothetical protein
MLQCELYRQTNIFYLLPLTLLFVINIRIQQFNVHTVHYQTIKRIQHYALIVSLLYSTCWLLHVSAVACHHQGAY